MDLNLFLPLMKITGPQKTAIRNVAISRITSLGNDTTLAILIFNIG